MPERDHLIKVVDKGQNVRLSLARTTALVEEAHQRHGTSATASAALGRVLTVAVIMGSDLKGHEEILTLRINGNGPAGTLLATADSQGGVRGLISNPLADLPSSIPGKLAVGELVGKDGYVEVSKDLGLKQPFTGSVPIISGEIAEDIAHYYWTSEQIPSLISLGVLVNPDLSIQAAGGLFVQALPEASDDILQMIESNILTMAPISNLLASYQQLEDIVPVIMKGIEYAVIGKQDLKFNCNCSRERLLGVLQSLPKEEVLAGSDREDIEVVCNFCQEHYSYAAEEII